MNSSRRSFIKQWSLVTAGSALAPSWLPTSGEAASRQSLAVPTQKVLGFVSSYSDDTRIVGAGALAQLRGKDAGVTRILAHVPNLGRLKSIWESPNLPGRMYAGGNTMAFSQDGANFAVENLLPEPYGDRVHRPRRARKANFAHDALLLNPETGRVSDPLRSTSNPNLILNNPGGTLPQVVDTILRGWTEAAELDVQFDEAFARLQVRILDAAASRPALARKILTSVVNRLVRLATVAAPKKLRALFRSRLLKSSLAAIRGQSAGDLVAEFDELRAVTGEEVSDGALWLVVLFGEEIASGILDSLLAGDPDDFFSAMATRSGVLQAQFVIANGVTGAGQ